MADAPCPVVILPGWGGSFRSVYGDLWLERFAGMDRKILPVELPGHADPDASTDPAWYRDLASLVAARLPTGRFDIVGFSLGAKIALEIALTGGSAVRRMVLGGVGDNVFAVEPAAEAIASALDSGITADTSPHAKAMAAYAEPSGSNPRALAAVLRRPPNPRHARARLATLSCPTLVVNGDEDLVAIPDGQLLASSPLIVSRHIAGVGHIDLPACPAFIEAAVAHLCRDSEAAAPEPSEA